MPAMNLEELLNRPCKRPASGIKRPAARLRDPVVINLEDEFEAALDSEIDKSPVMLLG